MKYNVKIDMFEGPLDLLLHLINRYEIDIYDIPVAEITEQYLNYIQAMKELQLDIASEYLVMAATLLSIKSKMLLPAQNNDLVDEELEVEEEDPRDELMRRLIEYRKFKEAAKHLKEFEFERTQLYTRPRMDLSHYAPEKIENPVSDVSLYDMLGALQKLFIKKSYKQPRLTTIHRQEIPIETRMREIIHELTDGVDGRLFHELFPYPHKEHIVVTFLAILELMKNNLIQCKQVGNFTDIWLYMVEGAAIDHDI